MSPAIAGFLGVAGFAGLAGWLIVRRKPVETAVKVMMFFGYFWLVAFSLLVLLAGAYYLREYL
ncbi:hypothetical protein [Methylomonas sp. UP202]|uniref:hypothetical protein n=1 Tax=unclassified Methylomonas TaxID=2608980 RepID=UPI00247AB5D0|nr:hypothetical protein [Methylomonas sp. UP202]WGS87826.1 hypothetical protein QC632_08700 [Methylomonas sp. UP202]